MGVGHFLKASAAALAATMVLSAQGAMADSIEVHNTMNPGGSEEAISAALDHILPATVDGVGNSLRLLGFYLLLFIAVIVLSMIVGIMLGLPLALVGGTVAEFGSALIGSLTNTAMVIVFMGVLAAVHRQLSGADGTVSDVFV